MPCAACFLGDTEPGPAQHAVVMFIVVRHRSAVVPPLLHILTSGSGAEAAAVGPGYPGPFLGDTEPGPGQHAVIMIIVFVPSPAKIVFVPSLTVD